MKRQWRRRRGRTRNNGEIGKCLCIVAIIIAVIYWISYGIYYLAVMTYGLIWIPVIVIIILIINKKFKSYKHKKKGKYLVYPPPTPNIIRYRVEYEQNKLKQLKENNIREMQAAQRKFKTFRKARYIPKNIRNAVWERDSGRCVKCGNAIGLEFNYIIPISRGGPNTVENIQISCKNCIKIKSDEIGFREIICPSCKRINKETNSEKINICTYCGADLKRN